MKCYAHIVFHISFQVCIANLYIYCCFSQCSKRQLVNLLENWSFLHKLTIGEIMGKIIAFSVAFIVLGFITIYLSCYNILYIVVGRECKQLTIHQNLFLIFRRLHLKVEIFSSKNSYHLLNPSIKFWLICSS